jgi:hypothetical protein
LVLLVLVTTLLLLAGLLLTATLLLLAGLLLPAALLATLLLATLLLLAGLLLPPALLATLLLLAGLLVWILIHFTFLSNIGLSAISIGCARNNNARPLCLFRATSAFNFEEKRIWNLIPPRHVPFQIGGTDDGTLPTAVVAWDTDTYTGADLDIRRLALTSEPAPSDGSAHTDPSQHNRNSARRCLLLVPARAFWPKDSRLRYRFT